jgi:hypothetical protein
LESFALYAVHLDVLGEFHVNHGAERAWSYPQDTRGSFWRQGGGSAPYKG